MSFTLSQVILGGNIRRSVEKILCEIDEPQYPFLVCGSWLPRLRGGDYSREHHALLVKFKGEGLNIRGGVIRRTTTAYTENSERTGLDT